jgi:hypothetical protein
VARYVAETGREVHPGVWQKFTLETRQPKAYPRGEAAVTQEMKDYGITTDIVDHWERLSVDAPEDVRAVVRDSVGVATPTPTSVEFYPWTATPIVDQIADRRSVFTERDLIPHVASLLPEGVTSTKLVESARRVLEAGLESGAIVRVLPHRRLEFRLPDGIDLSDDELAILHHLTPHADSLGGGSDRVLPGEARYTTRIQLEREQHVLDAVTRGSPVAVDWDALDSALTARGLVDEQAAAVRHLADLDGRLVTLVGPGGSGKTHAVGAYTDAAQAGGHHIVGVATSATAARRLGGELAAGWSGTIAMMRHQLDTYDTRLPPGTLMVVDEASMVYTRDLAWLVSQAEDCDGKIVLVGDPKQLPSIDSGGLFHRIVADGHGVVTDLAGINNRQTHELDRQALDKLRRREAAAAVHDYAEAGRIHLGQDEFATKTAMVDSWWTDAQTHGVDQVRMLASRRDEVAMLNQLARVHMQDEDILHGPALVKRWGTEFQAGDRIVVRDNWYAHADLRNGQTGTITTINPDTNTVRFRRDLDGSVIDLPGLYVDSSVDHAYAQTFHTTQGQTFHTTHLYVGTGVAAEHGYTGLSRAQDETHLWVNTSRNIDGRCIQPHGRPACEPPIDSLIRQFSRTVVQPPALAEGLAVEYATDQDLHHRLQGLEDLIRSGPLGQPLVVREPDIKNEPIEEARATAQLLGTSGSHAQVEYLEQERQQLLDQIAAREQWIEDNSDYLLAYTATKDELAARTTAVAISYQLKPPAEVLKTLGPRPSKPGEAIRWDTAVGQYAAARVSLGPDADLSDPTVLEARRWLAATDAYHPLPEFGPGPALKMIG